MASISHNATNATATVICVNNVNIFVNLVVSSDTVIKDLSADLQEKIKNKVKETTDLEVKEVNIIVKKAVQEKQTKSVSQDI